MAEKIGLQAFTCTACNRSMPGGLRRVYVYPSWMTDRHVLCMQCWHAIMISAAREILRQAELPL